MYDGPSGKWLVRETGVMIEVPEIWGHLFVGRTKEGFSLNKVMVGYAGWTLERATISDATIPILADGVKWLGYLPKPRLLWNLGVYGDAISEGQSFSTYGNQVVGRVAWVPMVSSDGGPLLHVGIERPFRQAERRRRCGCGRGPKRFRRRTSSTPARSRRQRHEDDRLEAYYRPGPFLVGTEYFFQHADAPRVRQPALPRRRRCRDLAGHRRDAAYNTRGGFFNQVSPRRTVFEGGPGAWELVARYSYIDLDSQAVHGGRSGG